MTYYRLLAAGICGLTTLALTPIATAQGTDLTALSAEDVLKLQVATGQTAEQLEEQLSDQLDFGAEDAFEERRKVQDYAQSLTTLGQGMTTGSYTAALPIRELTYDFDLKTHKICLPSSLLFQSETDGGTLEALVSISFADLAQKNTDTCPFVKSGHKPGVTLATGNYMEIKMDMAAAEQLHNSIEAEESLASFTCDELTFVPGRFDTGPAQLACATGKVDISVTGAPALSYSAEDAGDDDSWISRSGGDGSDASDGSTATQTAQTDDSTVTKESTGTQDGIDIGAEGAEGSDDAAANEVEPGTILTETALELGKSDRIEVQRRLTLLGYSTRGVDGIFGPGTRAGLSQWQIKNGLPVSGYLSSDQLDLLNVTSEALYQEWLVNNATTTTTTTKRRTKRKYYRGRDGCLRTRPGNARRTIIPGQSRFCNRRRRGLR